MEKKGFFISEEDLKIFKAWIESPEGQKAMIEALGKPKSQIEVWADNHKQAVWWHKIKDEPFTI
jgi:hypothetical protein